MSVGAASPVVPGPETAPRTSTASSEPRAPKEGYEEYLQQNPGDREIIKRVEERIAWSNRTTARWAIERQIFEQIAFFDGVQWIEYSEQSRRFTRWNAPSWFPTPVTNAIKPRVGAMTAQMLRAKPTGRVRPNTNDPEDREAANVADTLLAHADDVTEEEERRQDAAIVAALTGTVIFRDVFNPRAGRVQQVPRTTLVRKPAMKLVAQCATCGATDDPAAQGQPCPTCGLGTYQQGEVPQTFSNGEPAYEISTEPEIDPETGTPLIDQIPEGELETTVRMLFNFYWDPKATRLKDARWCGEATYTDLDWIDQNFPDFGPYVAVESGLDSSNFFEASLLALVGPSMQGSAHYGGTQQYTHGSVLRIYEEKPSAKYPNGLYAVVANGVLLHKGPLPIRDEQDIPTGDFSYTEFRYDIVPGKFPGSTPVADMVALQKRINGIDAQIILNRKTLMNPWVLAPKGSGLNMSGVLMRPGATALYNYIGVGAAPQVVPGTPLPQQVMDERQASFAAMDELAQDTRTSMGDLPPGVKSGIALNFLREQAEEQHAPRLVRWGLCYADRARKRLLLMQRHYRDERAIQVLGRGTDWQVAYWKGADIRGNVDVTVDPGSLRPRSRSQQEQTMFDALEQGIINIGDPVQRQKVIEALDLRDFETEIGPDRRRQQRENAALAQGQMVPINAELDNHEVHLMELVPVMKDPSFDSLGPDAQQAHYDHYHAHKAQLLMRLVAEDQAQQQPAPGGNPAGGPPGAVESTPGGADNQANATPAEAA